MTTETTTDPRRWPNGSCRDPKYPGRGTVCTYRPAGYWNPVEGGQQRNVRCGVCGHVNIEFVPTR